VFDDAGAGSPFLQVHLLPQCSRQAWNPPGVSTPVVAYSKSTANDDLDPDLAFRSAVDSERSGVASDLSSARRGPLPGGRR
jgi:hypothetical protein